MAVDTERHVTFGETCIGKSVRGVAFNRFAKILDTAVQSFSGSLRPVESALQIEVICVYVFRVTPGQKLLFRRTQLQAQLFRDLVADFLLDGENVRRSSSILIAPQLPAILDVNQFRADHE